MSGSVRQLGGRQRSVRLFAASLAATLIAATFVAAPADAANRSRVQAPSFDQVATFDQWEPPAFSYDGAYQANAYGTSLYWVNRQIGAPGLWNEGFTGDGIDVALIDTGVAPVDGLRRPGKVINGPDLSFDSQVAEVRYLDAYGHGTHLAGIIAGRADGAATISKSDYVNFVGVAPDARIVNLKVADAYGAVDVSQVIAAIDWVVEHKNDNGMDIRVLTLAYGTDGIQDYQIDPLTHAVERAWHAGIVVVVAAGNDGNGTVLRNPAADPFVISVGASENTGRWGYVLDDTVTDFSNCGSTARRPDLVAPGKSIISLRNPGSVADVNNPEARMGGDFFVGSGTSQAAAVVSGSVALLLEQRPSLTPNQVKELLVDNARSLSASSAACQGAGALNLRAARRATSPTVAASAQGHATAGGTGSLEAARGNMHVYMLPPAEATNQDPIPLTGEVDIMGNPWDGYDCPTISTCQSLWSGGNFNGGVWSGASWSGASWSGASWSGASWSGASWSGASWSGASWSGASWSGASWSGASWSGASWSGASWSNQSWSTEDWG